MRWDNAPCVFGKSRGGSRRFNGQCFTFNGRKTALWTHPREIEEVFHREPWSVDDLDGHYATIEPIAPYSPKFVE